MPGIRWRCCCTPRRKKFLHPILDNATLKFSRNSSTEGVALKISTYRMRLDISDKL